MDTLTMNDSHTIPTLGFGTWRIDDDHAADAVASAIQVGYRHIDTAAIYSNEAGVGLGIARSGVAREELFITTKLWNSDQSDPEAALRTSLSKLGLDFVDLYLIHWPAPSQKLYTQAWEAMIALRDKGLATSIGVSNFYPSVLDALQPSGVVPAVNQVEIHPSFANRETVADDAARGILTESYSPLGRSNDLLNPMVEMVAARLGVTPAQVVIAWHLAKNLIVIPKSSNRDRMRSNFEARTLRLTESDIAAIDSVDTGVRMGTDPSTM